LPKSKKPFSERPGDWVCIKCKNLNFSFRNSCNRCETTKIESNILYDQYLRKVFEEAYASVSFPNWVNTYNDKNNGLINEFNPKLERFNILIIF